MRPGALAYDAHVAPYAAGACVTMRRYGARVDAQAAPPI